MQDGFDLFGSYVEDFGDLIDRHTGFEIFEDGLDGHASSAKDPRALNLTGMLSIAQFFNQLLNGLNSENEGRCLEARAILALLFL